MLEEATASLIKVNAELELCDDSTDVEYLGLLLSDKSFYEIAIMDISMSLKIKRLKVLNKKINLISATKKVGLIGYLLLKRFDELFEEFMDTDRYDYEVRQFAGV